MGGTADIPILQDFASGGVGMGGAGVGMASRYLSAMQGFLCAHVAGGLFKNLTAIVWMHRRVAVPAQIANMSLVICWPPYRLPVHKRCQAAWLNCDGCAGPQTERVPCTVRHQPLLLVQPLYPAISRSPTC